MSILKKVIAIPAGFISFVASIMTIHQFIDSKRLFLFWTQDWWLSIFFIFLLFIVALILTLIGSGPEKRKYVLVLSGCVYLLLTLAWYCYFAYTQIFSGLKPLPYLGHGFILLISTIVSVLCFNYSGLKTLIVPAYGFLLAGLGVLLAWMYKYLFAGSFSWILIQFCGEALIFVFGSIVFGVTFKKSETDSF